MRSINERETGEQILDILKKVFLTTDIVTQLQQKFYQRDQRENETLESYSLALMQLSERANRTAGKEMPVKDHTLIERFIDGLRDQHLRQEMGMFALDKGKMPFLEFRFQMLRSIEATLQCIRVFIRLMLRVRIQNYLHLLRLKVSDVQ